MEDSLNRLKAGVDSLSMSPSVASPSLFLSSWKPKSWLWKPMYPPVSGDIGVIPYIIKVFYPRQVAVMQSIVVHPILNTTTSYTMSC